MENDIAISDVDKNNLKQVKTDFNIVEGNKTLNKHLNYDTILEHIGQFGRYTRYFCAEIITKRKYVFKFSRCS